LRRCREEEGGGDGFVLGVVTSLSKLSTGVLGWLLSSGQGEGVKEVSVSVTVISLKVGDWLWGSLFRTEESHRCPNGGGGG